MKRKRLDKKTYKVLIFGMPIGNCESSFFFVKSHWNRKFSFSFFFKLLKISSAKSTACNTYKVWKNQNFSLENIS